MQLSPRQYQADPTGAAYVQDTRPLMAAMGAQAASQIESNRMMTETMQKGMQGIENFAARRQLAAARAQLGSLDTNAEDYGQKLAGLVLDNPLAFTNAKTAPIANMAFKQASDENQARLARKYQLADMATKFGYEKDLITLRGQVEARNRVAASRLTPEQKFLSSQEGRLLQKDISNIDSQISDIRDNKIGLSEEASRAADAEIQRLQGERDARIADARTFAATLGPDSEISPLDGSVMNVAPAASPASLAAASAQTVPSAAGSGTPLPTEGGTSDLVSGLIPFTEEGIPIEVAATPETVSPQESIPVRAALPVEEPMIPTPEIDILSLAPYSSPASPLTPPALTEEQLQAQKAQQAISDKEALDREILFRKMTAPEKQTVIKSLVDQDPVIRLAKDDLQEKESNLFAVQEEYKNITSRTSSATDDEKRVALGDLQRAKRAVDTKKDEVSIAESRLSSELRNSGDPFATMDDRVQGLVRDREMAAQREKQMIDAKAALKIETEAAAKRAVENAIANKTDLELSLANIETKKAGEAKKLVDDTNKQWTESKQEVKKALGGEKALVQIATDILSNDILGLSLLPVGAQRLSRKTQLAERIKNEIPEGKLMGTGDDKDTAFSQKAERKGFQTVSWDEVIESLAEEILVSFDKVKASGATTNFVKDTFPKMGSSTIVTE